jgi:hypothetical protein
MKPTPPTKPDRVCEVEAETVIINIYNCPCPIEAGLSDDDKSMLDGLAVQMDLRTKKLEALARQT